MTIIPTPGSGPILPFPFLMEPLTQVTPFSYRDGMTYAKMVENLRCYLNTYIVPAFNEKMDEIIVDFQEGITNAENTTIQSKLDWQEFFEEFMEFVDARLQALNDQAVANLVNNQLSQLRIALDANFASKATQTTVETGRLSSESIDARFTDLNNSTKIRDTVTYHTGTVTDTTPLQVTFDGDTVAVNATSLMKDLAVGQRVTVAKQDTRVVVISRETGQPIDWAAISPMLKASVGEKLTVPTHVTPSGGQSVHPSVVKFDEPWNGYRYWMAHTPYQGGDDSYEDPNVCASNDGISWVVPAGLINPLDDAPGSPRYNSDTDLVYAQGKLWCFWRYRDTTAGAYSENMYVRTSINGVTWTTKELVYQSNMAARALVSPSLIYTGTKWIMHAVDIASSPSVMVRLQSAGASPLINQWGGIEVCNLPTIGGSQPWHVQVRLIDGVYVALLNTCLNGTGGSGGNLYFRTSRDGLNFRGSLYRAIPQGSDDHNIVYRATFVPEVIGGLRCLRIWYSAAMIDGVSVWNIFHTVATISSDFSIFAVASGPIPPQTVLPDGTVHLDIDFPKGRFTQPPMVQTSLSDNVKEVVVTGTNVTTTKFSSHIASNATVSVAAGGRWLATQMTPKSNEG